eukprot:COSAG06_NODE_763_length_12486_cov_37.835244_5_plen_89_part_00
MRANAPVRENEEVIRPDTAHNASMHPKISQVFLFRPFGKIVLRWTRVQPSMLDKLPPPPVCTKWWVAEGCGRPSLTHCLAAPTLTLLQ